MKIRTILFVLVLTPAWAFGTHLKGGYIRIQQVTAQGLDYRITLRIYSHDPGR
jgi:hypothetical protein